MSFFSLQGLRAGYGHREVLRTLSLELKERELVVLIGPNGSGKSTFFRALFGLADVYSIGSFEFIGRSVRLMGHDRWFKSNASYVPQYQNVFASLSLEENIRVSLTNAEDSDGLLERAVPESLRSRDKEPAGRLSGGQKQMLAIAMGAVQGRRLLLLDEPLAGLDESATERVVATIADIAKNTTIVVAEHRYSRILSLANRLIGMKDGRIVMDMHDIPSAAPEDIAARTNAVFFT